VASGAQCQLGDDAWRWRPTEFGVSALVVDNVERRSGVLTGREFRRWGQHIEPAMRLGGNGWRCMMRMVSGTWIRGEGGGNGCGKLLWWQTPLLYGSSMR
jgi:hypothetical protein